MNNQGQAPSPSYPIKLRQTARRLRGALARPNSGNKYQIGLLLRQCENIRRRRGTVERDIFASLFLSKYGPLIDFECRT